jgi:hypothetical protein
VRHGIELFRSAKEKGLKGIIAKRAAGSYQPGRHSPDWLKIKARLKKEFVIGGITEGKGSRKQFGALLLAPMRMVSSLESYSSLLRCEIKIPIFIRTKTNAKRTIIGLT